MNGDAPKTTQNLLLLGEVTPPHGHVLRILLQRGVRSVALPTTPATLILGRAGTAEVSIDDATVSRRHAALYVGARFFIEDLGSANGTTVASYALAKGERREVFPGDLITVGSVRLFLERESTLAPCVLSHDAFVTAAGESLGRMGARGVSAVVLSLQVHHGVPAQAVVSHVASVLGPSACMGQFAFGEYEALCSWATPGSPHDLTRELVARFTINGCPPRVGMAWFPGDGVQVDQLLARARAAIAASTTRPASSDAPRLVVADPQMVEIHAVLRRVAKTPISILLLGETGVGKEELAELVHRSSARASGPYLALNCAALSETLLESELFGHEKGAFTGATRDKRGLLESANGGTLLLDELGDINAELQVKLLRVLEEKRVTPVGGVKSRPIDVRIIAATHRNLKILIHEGRFREDLFYRINGVTVEVPPLRARPAEIELLAQAFIDRFARTLDPPRTFALSEAARRLLLAYGWPGNIRELRNVMERAVVLCDGDAVDVRHMPPELCGEAAPSARIATEVMPAGESLPDFQPDAVEPGLGPEELEEKRRILDALRKTAGNQSKAAALLNMPRRTLIRRLERYGIRRPRLDPDQ
ncbi:MAG: sigma 54-interacting transcriptional regulator [Deltaproteobacteria bacterium]|nr:sigma 54-interacting transcriptional regulator [Deltaproteobacteria bacterium]